MNLLLLAHHVDVTDYPILAAMFAAGFCIGWDVITKLMPARPSAQNGDEGIHQP